MKGLVFDTSTNLELRTVSRHLYRRFSVLRKILDMLKSMHMYTKREPAFVKRQYGNVLEFSVLHRLSLRHYARTHHIRT